MMRWSTGIWAALALLALAGCGASEAKNDAAKPPPAPTLTVTTVAAEERRLPGTLDVTGTLTADAQTDVAAEIAGRVLTIAVERGMPVRAGAVLARLDPADARHALDEAEATAAQTEARLGIAATGGVFDPERTPEARRARAAMERAQIEFERYERLVGMGAVSRSDYDLRRTEALTAREQYASALNDARQLYQALQAQRARVAMARKALTDADVRAPWDGVVAERHVTAGQYLAKGARVVTLVRVDPLRVELTIPEAAVAAVRRGQKVAFGVQAYPERTFEGTVAYVGPSVRPDSRALVVEALVPNRDGRLSPGLFATARLELPAARPTVLVPAAAVTTTAGVSTVFVARAGRAELRIVQVGRTVGDQVEIERGLAANEPIITGASDRIVDGAPLADR